MDGLSDAVANAGREGGWLCRDGRVGQIGLNEAELDVFLAGLRDDGDGWEVEFLGQNR